MHEVDEHLPLVGRNVEGKRSWRERDQVAEQRNLRVGQRLERDGEDGRLERLEAGNRVVRDADVGLDEFPREEQKQGGDGGESLALLEAAFYLQLLEEFKNAQENSLFLKH